MPPDEPISACNDTPAQEYPVTVGCSLLWSLAQEFSYLRLSDKNADNEYELIGLYAARARRIAATYARFYLETEDGGDPSKLGRYYWMALGAFASKTVACLLDTWQLNASYAGGRLTLGATDMHEIANGLGKGNLWLFGDIAPPHWFYNHYAEHFFDGMACIHERDVNDLEDTVRETVNDLPWASDSLGPIDHFRPSDDLIEGFRKVVEIEQLPESRNRRQVQFKHLMAIADHEQGAILQPLIYDEEIFAKWSRRQRWPIVRSLSPKFELVFSHQCSECDENLKSEAPKDMRVEDFRNRMNWIEEAALQFHGLMQTKSSYMNQEIRTISSWVNYEDARWVY